jgi:hypothetical protein
VQVPPQIEKLNAGHEEKLELDDCEFEGLKAEAGPRRFRCTAYTGKDVSRIFGRMVVDVSGINVPTRMGMLLEHDDRCGVAVCDGATKTGGRLRLEGYFLDDVASKGEASALIAKADQGWPLKMSVGIRFTKHSFYEEGVEFEVNGKKLRGPMVCVDECDLFETSFIHVNPADLDTEASVMRAKAQEQQRMADGEQTPVVDKLGGQTRDEILAEGEKLAMEKLQKERLYEAALRQAFPGKGEKSRLRRDEARKQGLTIEQIQAQGLDRMKNRLARFEARDRENKTALEQLAQRHQTATSPGVDRDRLEVVQNQGEVVIAKNLDERVYAELRGVPRLQEVLGSNGGVSAEQMVASWLKAQGRRATRDGRPILVDMRAQGGRTSPETFASLKRMSQDVLDGIEAQRLDVGSSGPDYSKVVVNGFQGQFYNGYEEELSKNWSTDLSFQIPSDQEAEILRWLSAPPMIQEWSGPRIAKSVQVYQQLIQAVKFEGTLHVDRFDWDHQKFDLIAKSFGLFGAVASQHWDIRFTKLLEANPTAYDSVAMFSAAHTLGGDSGTIVNDYSATGTGSTKGIAPSLNVANPAQPTQLEWANIILQLTPKFRSFAWANGIKMHGTARQWGIMVHPDVEGNLQAAISSERLDLGASNPLFGQRSQYKVIPNAYLTDPTIGYIFRLDTSNKALLRAEPDPLEMSWQGPGSHMAFHEDKYAMGLRCVRAIAPGAFESVIRFQLGNT